MATTTVSENKIKDIILLLLRLFVGGWLMYAGVPKLINGPEMWAKVGENMGMFGIESGYTFWGFMAAFAEGVGGLMIILGLFFRIGAFLALVTMFVATYMHITVMKGGYWPALTLGVLCLIFLFTGPGRYSIDKRK